MSTPAEVGRWPYVLLGRGAFDEAAILYEDDAVFIEVDGVAAGREAISDAHRPFIDSGLRVPLIDYLTFVVGDLALGAVVMDRRAREWRGDNRTAPGCT